MQYIPFLWVLFYPLTTFTFVCPILVIWTLIGAINASKRADFGALMVLPLSGLCLLSLLIWGLDRTLVVHFSSLSLSIVEAVIISTIVLGLWLRSAYEFRKVIIDCRSGEREYFVLIENNGQLNASHLGYAFPFNKKLHFQGNSAVIDKEDREKARLGIKLPAHWKPRAVFRFFFHQDKRLYFYGPRDTEMSPALKEKLKKELRSHIHQPKS